MTVRTFGTLFLFPFDPAKARGLECREKMPVSSNAETWETRARDPCDKTAAALDKQSLKGGKLSGISFYLPQSVVSMNDFSLASWDTDSSFVEVCLKTWA